MKTLLLATVLIIGYTMTVFAQPQSFGNTDSGAGKFKIGKPGIAGMNDSFKNGKLDVPFSTKNLYFQDPKDKEVKIGKLAEGIYMAQTGMPILIPKGAFSMPVVKPDSSIHFFMQIVEIKKHPSNDFR